MRLPWVSRLAYDLVTDERDRLRAKNDQLESSLVAIQRSQSGLPETPYTPKPRERPEIPDDIEELIADYGSEVIRSGLREQAERLAESGAPWEDVRDALRAQGGGVEDALAAEVV